MDEFAQSRGDDDLFDDEIIPLESTPQNVDDTATQIQRISLNPPAASPSSEGQTPAATLPAQTSSYTARGTNRGRGRGRGQTRESNKPGGLADSKYAPKTPSHNVGPELGPQSSGKDASESKDSLSSKIAAEEQTPPITAPKGPSNVTPSRPPAVRGDRTATGGLRRAKLTEEELSAKLAAAKERSQNLAAAHARAQADAENFAERERVAGERRAKETEERKALEGERERNRVRKLRALGGREWDAGKDEQDMNRGTRVRRQGDFQEEDNDLSMYEWKEDRGRGQGRGRGRGRAGRGGRGRGDGRYDGRAVAQTQPNVDAEADFPALPGPKTTSPERKLMPGRQDSANVGGSWADQVESSEAAKS